MSDVCYGGEPAIPINVLWLFSVCPNYYGDSIQGFHYMSSRELGISAESGWPACFPSTSAAQ